MSLVDDGFTLLACENSDWTCRENVERINDAGAMEECVRLLRAR